uniref:Uncharacterized protein n=1 Tax=Trichogramma kaykai TaxID=54128 RepID=A0ABD2XHT8_9HYME
MEETVIVTSYPSYSDWLISEYIMRKNHDYSIGSPIFSCNMDKKWYFKLDFNYHTKLTTICLVAIDDWEKLDLSGSFICILNSAGEECDKEILGEILIKVAHVSYTFLTLPIRCTCATIFFFFY